MTLFNHPHHLTFKEESAISSLGGKNMVSSIQHWAEVTGVLNIDRRDGMKAELSEFGKFFFDDNGRDPFWKILVHYGISIEISISTNLHDMALDLQLPVFN